MAGQSNPGAAGRARGTSPRVAVAAVPDRGAPLREGVGWLERYRRFWDESFDRLGEYLPDLQQKEERHGRGK